MTNDLILRGVRDALHLDADQLIEIFALAGQPVTPTGLEAALLPLADWGSPCTDAALTGFLDALVLQKRGPSKNPGPPRRGPLTNNVVLKKLRAALQLHESDVLDALAAGGQASSPRELRGIFRKPGHKDFRPCGDEVLTAFFSGLAAQTTA
ncbi:MAG: DUF1456 family protein [Proteobacteria bacterium]|nr:DUF1456 family protein [Pseudomonadota bacterium]MCP4918735.1 DUF1456 family protein [Pseudomonadota bacterium]